jgi:hypothetical protein
MQSFVSSKLYAMNEKLELEREAAFRRVALYIGPLLLGDLAARSMYRVICEGRTVALVSGPQHVLWSSLWIVMLLLVSWRLRDPLARIATGLWGIQHALIIYGSMSDVTISRTVIGTLTIGVGVLLTLSGARWGTPRWSLIVPGMFVGMFVFSWTTRHYSDVLMGRDSIFRASPFC